MKYLLAMNAFVKKNLLLFRRSGSSTTCAFEIIHLDIWELALAVSKGAYCYYVAFIVDFT